MKSRWAPKSAWSRLPTSSPPQGPGHPPPNASTPSARVLRLGRGETGEEYRWCIRRISQDGQLWDANMVLDDLIKGSCTEIPQMLETSRHLKRPPLGVTACSGMLKHGT